jgi:hypothetical protein
MSKEIKLSEKRRVSKDEMLKIDKKAEATIRKMVDELHDLYKGIDERDLNDYCKVSTFLLFTTTKENVAGQLLWGRSRDIALLMDAILEEEFEPICHLLDAFTKKHSMIGMLDNLKIKRDDNDC